MQTLTANIPSIKVHINLKYKTNSIPYQNTIIVRIMKHCTEINLSEHSFI